MQGLTIHAAVISCYNFIMEAIALHAGVQPELQDDRTFVQQWGADVLAQLAERYDEETIGQMGTSILIICQVRQAQALAHEARLENAFYGNRSPGITDEELSHYTERRLAQPAGNK